MGLKVTNNAFGTLNAGITNSDTTVVLQSGQGSRFPTLDVGDYFYATLIDTSNNLEIVKVTARSTDTMTIVRAQDNTTARAYATNDRFELRPTAAMLNEVITKADTAQATADAALPLAGGTMTGPLAFTMVTGSKIDLYKETSGDGDWYGVDVASNQLRLFSGAAGATNGGVLIGKRDLSTFTEHMRIRNDGVILTPKQPAFIAGGTSTNFALTAGARIVVPYDYEVYDRTGAYNPSTYRFTAPVAGVYMFHASYLKYPNSLSTGTYISFAIVVNGGAPYAGQGLSLSRWNAALDQTTQHVTQIHSLAAGDYVEAVVNSTQSTSIYTQSGHAAFFGYLIG